MDDAIVDAASLREGWGMLEWLVGIVDDFTPTLDSLGGWTELESSSAMDGVGTVLSPDGGKSFSVDSVGCVCGCD